MFQLFKKRSTGDLINDSIAFFKLHGKHYFKSYFAINGVILALLVLSIYFVGKVYFEFITTLTSNAGSNVNPDTIYGTYFENNLPIFISVFIGMFVLIIISSMINFTYPVVYLDLYNNRKGAKFDTRDILQALKSNAGKIIKFVIGTMFTIMPLMMIAFFINILLCIVLIGIPLFFILIPAFVCWMSLSFYAYITEDIRFFTALGEGYDLLKQNFWPTIGATLIITILIQIIQVVITMIPYMAMMGSMFTTLKDNRDPAQMTEFMSTLSIAMTFVMVASTVISYIFQNLQLINQGLIYYSLREANEENTTHSAIDLIGSDSE